MHETTDILAFHWSVNGAHVSNEKPPRGDSDFRSKHPVDDAQTEAEEDNSKEHVSTTE